MPEEKPAPEEVKIRRSYIPVPGMGGEPAVMVYVTYTVKGLSPGLIPMRKDQWSEEAEAILIKKDIEERRARKPVSIRL